MRLLIAVFDGTHGNIVCNFAACIRGHDGPHLSGLHLSAVHLRLWERQI
jgi:hypothetical protein